MACIKIAKTNYNDRGCLERLIHKYVFPKAVCIGGMRVDVDHSAWEMEVVKQIWMQQDGKQLFHFILSFSEYESTHYTDGYLEYIAYDICRFFADYYQIVFGIHHGNNLHIHFVCNTISYRDGSRLYGSNRDIMKLKEYVQLALDSRVEVYFN